MNYANASELSARKPCLQEPAQAPHLPGGGADTFLFRLRRDPLPQIPTTVPPQIPASIPESVRWKLIRAQEHLEELGAETHRLLCDYGR
jgi:hypothetical protein